MTWQTVLLFDVPLPWPLAGFIFCGTVCSYNFHWYLIPPSIKSTSVKVRWNLANRPVHLVLALAALCGAAFFSFLLLPYWPWLLVTAFVTFLYSAPKVPLPAFHFLKKVAVGKTIFLAFAWTHVTCILPVVLRDSHPGDDHVLYVGSRFLFIYAICIVFDYRDRDSDRREGIRTLVTTLDEGGIHRLFWGTMAFSLAGGLLLLPYFDVLTVILLLLPLLPLALLYRRALQSRSDYLYYFILDGLMMLSAPLVILAKFAR